jgi:hypothetical protein
MFKVIIVKGVGKEREVLEPSDALLPLGSKSKPAEFAASQTTCLCRLV